MITAVGEAVSDRTVGQRVILSIQAPASIGAPEYKGTYRSQFVAPATETIPVPDGIDEALIGALWLPFLTAWGRFGVATKHSARADSHAASGEQ